MDIFGFSIKRKTDEIDSDNQGTLSFVEPQNDESAIDVYNSGTAAGGAMTSIIDLEGNASNEALLIKKYRGMMLQPEVQQAVDDIINESINITYDSQPVEVVTDDLEIPEGVKKKIREEFNNILKLLDFSNQGYDIFSKWYVDGRLNYHTIIDESNPKLGIKEVRYIDPRKLKKVREFDNIRVAGSGGNGATVKRLRQEYYVYTERGFNYTGTSQGGLKISKDSIVHVNSGILNDGNTMILSHLDKAFKPLNQLRMMEDASVIYRISRAPERRVFYIDVGSLPKAKAEQYLRDVMTRQKNRLIYDAATGEIRDDRKYTTMTDDFYLARREGGRGTEVTTLPGGQNLGEMEDIVYFQRRLYKALNVPISRLESESQFQLGRSSEISRDEVKFSKFVRRLRVRFSILFDKLLERQLILKGIISTEDWALIKEGIRYDFQIDNHFEELKQAEILQNRLQILQDVDNHTGKYFSKKWVQRTVLKMTDDEIKEMEKEIAEEPKDDDFGDDEGDDKGDNQWTN